MQETPQLRKSQVHECVLMPVLRCFLRSGNKSWQIYVPVLQSNENFILHSFSTMFPVSYSSIYQLTHQLLLGIFAIFGVGWRQYFTLGLVGLRIYQEVGLSKG